MLPRRSRDYFGNLAPRYDWALVPLESLERHRIVC
jgi:hypothetical protein